MRGSRGYTKEKKELIPISRHINYGIAQGRDFTSVLYLIERGVAFLWRISSTDPRRLLHRDTLSAWTCPFFLRAYDFVVSLTPPPLHRPQSWSIRDRGTASPGAGTVPCLLVVAGIPIASISLVRAAEFLVCLTPKPTSKLLTVGFFVPTSSTYLPPCGSHRLSLFLNHHLPRLGECRSALGTYQHIPYRFSWSLDIFFFPFLFAPTGRLAIPTKLPVTLFPFDAPPWRWIRQRYTTQQSCELVLVTLDEGSSSLLLSNLPNPRRPARPRSRSALTWHNGGSADTNAATGPASER